MLDQLIFVGFNSRVAALDRANGNLIWQWRSPKGSGYTTVLLDGDRLIVSVAGYTYCLDPQTGQQLWFNELKGFGTGVTSLASVRGSIGNIVAAASEIAESESASAATTATHAG
jgi:outer membrane protein assembly factor BamB